MPVKHIVMFEVPDDVPAEKVEKLKQGLLSLPGEIDVITEYELGEDLKLEGGQTHPAGKNRTISWSACFASVEHYETYEKHQAHIDVVNNKIKPIITPGSRAAIQYKY
jgi:hypothetical protein